MRVKVLCNVLVYNGELYRKGDYLEVESEEERAILIRERCIRGIEEKKASKSAGNQQYVPSGDAIEEILASPDRTKRKRGGK